ncbi:unnamed protein product [Effrenium voratum]|nr:unnamed protein product [Effrenium voratum]
MADSLDSSAETYQNWSSQMPFSRFGPGSRHPWHTLLIRVLRTHQAMTGEVEKEKSELLGDFRTLPAAAWERLHGRFRAAAEAGGREAVKAPSRIEQVQVSAAEDPASGPVATPQLQILLEPSDGEDVNVLVRLQTPDQAIGGRDPVDIICVLDISGSMGLEAKIASGEGGGLSLLDVAKHGVRTVLHALQPEDRLALVLFDHDAQICFDLTKMDEAGMNACEEKIKPISQRGATNISLGLEEGLRVCREGQDGEKRLAHLILLTDGQTADRNQVVPRMRAARGPAEQLPCTVSTFGFGYNIDSPLLVEMALEGSGVYSFIPDAGFVGTVFVNHISNLLTTMACSASLVLDPDEGAEIKEVFGGLPVMDAGSGSKRVDLATLQFGQTKDVVLRMSVKSKEAFLAAQASYTLPGGEKAQTDFVEAKCPASSTQVCLQHWRLQVAKTLEEAVAKASHAGEASCREAFDMLKSLSNKIRAAAAGQYENEQFLKDLLTDLEGEATSAVEGPAAFTKWGRHYLPSLMFAHRRQMCNNFKDPGVQNYGGDMFQDIQSHADDMFNQLPPPEPTNRRGSSVAYPAVRSMAAYNDASAG